MTDRDDNLPDGGCCPDCAALVPLPARFLSPGDWITEVGTPDGPWHLVAEVDPDAGVLVLDLGDGLTVPVAFRPEHAVLKVPRCDDD